VPSCSWVKGCCTLQRQAWGSGIDFCEQAAGSFMHSAARLKYRWACCCVIQVPSCEGPCKQALLQSMAARRCVLVPGWVVKPPFVRLSGRPPWLTRE
jgi:hypothetical protein